jgi:hypothetical protein
MNVNNCLFSTIPDNNIFHIFACDIIKRYKTNVKHIFIDENNIDKNNSCQLWRLFVMKKLYPDANIQFKKTIAKPSKETHGGYESWKFTKYPLDSHIYEIIDKINSKCTPEYILLNQRSYNNRYLYDYETKLPLQDYLLTKEFKYPVKICNFETMTPEEQYDICSKAKLFISAHGAGCTNLIFTPIDCPLIEINLRKHWHCDPVCDDHYFEKISINEKCNGKLIITEDFHKADYHNLCYLSNKKYTEIEGVCYVGKFNDRNPISKQEVHIDGEILTKIIEEYIQ